MYGREDHVPTAGPRGTKFIEYFTCKQFVEMKPADWFQLLKKKGFYFQCLYPGKFPTKKQCPCLC